MSGSTSCYPVVAGSLPTTAQRARGDFGCQRAKLFGRLPKRTGWQPVLPENYRFLYLGVGRGRGAGRGLDVGVDLGVRVGVGVAPGATLAGGVDAGVGASPGVALRLGVSWAVG